MFKRGEKELIMKKGLKKVLSVLVVGALMVTSIVGFSVTSFAASDSSEDSVSDSSSYRVYYVGTESELRSALIWSNPGDYIQFSNDISVSGNLYVNKSVTINLNYHSLIFYNSVKGLTITTGNLNRVNLYNGCVYASVDSDAAVSVRSGDLRVYNCSLFAGDCNQHEILYYGNALYCNSISSRIYLDYVYLQGGNGYSRGSLNSSRTGKAIYLAYAGSGVYAVGSGYTFLDGKCI